MAFCGEEEETSAEINAKSEPRQGAWIAGINSANYTETEGRELFAAGFRAGNLSAGEGDAVDGSDLIRYQYPKRDVLGYFLHELCCRPALR